MINQILPEITAMSTHIIEEIHPERIILFGSRARGDAGQDADVDLLVIMAKPPGSTAAHRDAMIRLKRKLAKYHIPTDLLVTSTEDVEHWKYSINHVLARALREGKLLYERS